MILLSGIAHDLPGTATRQDLLVPHESYYSPRRGSIYRGIILHHDVALSTACLLADARQRKPPFRISTHFSIDNDGAIVQLADPLVWRAWSAGVHDAGRIAIDISNICYPAYAAHYQPRRPLQTQTISGQRITYLGPDPRQVASLVALCRLLCRVVGIPAVCPTEMRLLDPVPDGVIGHMHCQRGKVDPFGLDWYALAEALRS